jgi:peptidoglycan hydrolase-like protein with peptidoglycan-binding domain
LGYYEGPVNGNYGQSTEIAVLNFQKAIGLSADGIAGPSTLSRLQEVQKAKTETPKPPPQSSPDPAPEMPQGKWIGWLIGVIAIAVTGTGILYLLNRTSRPSKQARLLPKPDVLPTSSLKPEPNSSQPPNQPHAATPGSKVEVNNNGHSVPVEAVNGSQQSQTVNPKELTVRETTRLPKLHIVEELVKDLRSPDPAKRRKAIWELGQRGDTQAVQPLVDLMIDSDSKQRSLILASLSEIGVRTLKPMNRALAISLQDENPEVRKNAIRDITRIYDLVGQISQLLRHATEDPDVEVQETARWALNQVNRIRTISHVEGVPALKNAVSPPESLPENISEP